MTDNINVGKSQTRNYEAEIASLVKLTEALINETNTREMSERLLKAYTDYRGNIANSEKLKNQITLENRTQSLSPEYLEKAEMAFFKNRELVAAIRLFIAEISVAVPNEILAEPLMRSGLFNKDYYLARNDDVAAHEIDPLVHFIIYGNSERRSPSNLFEGADA